MVIITPANNRRIEERLLVLYLELKAFSYITAEFIEAKQMFCLELQIRFA